MLTRFFLFIFVFINSLTYSQNYTLYNPTNSGVVEKCLSDQRENTLIQNTEYAQKRQSAEFLTNLILDQNKNNLDRDVDDLYTIPVVFHVIHKGESPGSGTNISDEQLYSAIDALNRDFQASNADGGIAQSDIEDAAGNTFIEFCLASIDPNGNPTSGINRINGTSVSNYAGQGITDSNELQVKNLSRWDNRYYLNIWVVSEIDNNNADVSDPNDFTGGVLGYAYFPTNPVTFNASLDGVVIINLSVGNDPEGTEGYRLAPFTLLNRTLTHEVGHSLNLYHTFQGQSCSEFNCTIQGDKVCDTPPTTLNYNCNTPACSGNQQVENYLDYSDDDCMELFTSGQKDRMRASLEGVRSELINTSNCAIPFDYDVSLEFAVYDEIICGEESIILQVKIKNTGTLNISSLSFNYQINDEPSEIFNWTGSLSSGAEINVDLPELDLLPGTNEVEIDLIENSLNGSQLDENNTNNTDLFTIDKECGYPVRITIVLDNYPTETSWELINDTEQIILSGGPYQSNQAHEVIEEIICLPAACYSFNISDVFGDGICCEFGDGSYTIEDISSGEILVSGGGFDFFIEEEFCISNALADTIQISACESYTYQGFTYTESGVYEISENSSASCESTTYLDLTILENSSSELFISTCDSYTAPDGNIYTNSGDYVAIIENSASCDSIIQIDLEITGYTDDCGVCISEGESNPEWNSSCVDCTGIPNGNNLPGSECDDGDPDTEEDVYDAVCECAGTQIWASIEGSVNWNANCGERNATIRLYEPGTSNLMATYIVLVSVSGEFYIEDIASGVFDIFFKLDGYLQTAYSNIDLNPGNNQLEVTSLSGGDFNNNNFVNIQDVSMLNPAMNSSIGDVNYNPIADLNCDGNINITDVSILNSTFGQAGISAPLD